MFTEQINQFQARFTETFSAAQKRAQMRAREFEVEARKVLETLGDRAQAELKVLLRQAQGLSKEQVGQLGAELVKLGNHLQELSQSWKAAGRASGPSDATKQDGAKPAGHSVN
jgi:F0F1-type ATP synthase membrane subunit b/b'